MGARQMPSHALCEYQFTTAPLSPGQIGRFKALEQLTIDLDREFRKLTLFSREQGHGRTKLQEFLFWSRKALEMERYLEGRRAAENDADTSDAPIVRESVDDMPTSGIS